MNVLQGRPWKTHSYCAIKCISRILPSSDLFLELVKEHLHLVPKTPLKCTSILSQCLRSTPYCSNDGYQMHLHGEFGCLHVLEELNLCRKIQCHLVPPCSGLGYPFARRVTASQRSGKHMDPIVHIPAPQCFGTSSRYARIQCLSRLNKKSPTPTKMSWWFSIEVSGSQYDSVSVNYILERKTVSGSLRKVNQTKKSKEEEQSSSVVTYSYHNRLCFTQPKRHCSKMSDDSMGVCQTLCTSLDYFSLIVKFAIVFILLNPVPYTL